MKAVKGNKEYAINEEQKASYQEAGYDILDDNGKMIASGRGKNVSMELYEKALEENKKLKKELTAMKKEASQSKEKTGEEKAGE